MIRHSMFGNKPSWSDAKKSCGRIRQAAVDGGCRVHVVSVEAEGHGTGSHSKRLAELAALHRGGGSGGQIDSDPTHAVAKAIRDALNPDMAPKAVLTLREMTPDKRAAIEVQYASANPNTGAARKKITVRFGGICDKCGVLIEQGELATWRAGKNPLRHVRCPEGKELRRAMIAQIVKGKKR